MYEYAGTVNQWNNRVSRNLREKRETDLSDRTISGRQAAAMNEERQNMLMHLLQLTE